MRRTLVVGCLAVGWLLVTAGPAGADPPGPTSYDSVVTGVETADGEPVDLDVDVLGGDAFLVVRAPDGAEIEVPGYDDEPFVRISAEGTVEVNQRSPTHWFNEDRYGADVPEVADAGATPVWRTVTDEGVYAWHDHRIHWMSPSPPEQVDTSRREPQDVFDWEIPMLLDGEPVLARGELSWHPGPPGWVVAAWLAAGLAVAGLLVRRTRLTAPVLAAVVSLPAGAAGVAKAVGQPPGGEGDLLLIVLPALALVVSLVAVRLSRREPDGAGPWVLGGAATLPLLVWGVLQIGALTRPIVPAPLTAPMLRPVVAAALGLGAVGLVELARRALGALPDTLER